jgi:hypothetical protein
VVALVVHVWSPTDEVTVYDVTGVPPEVGAVHETDASTPERMASTALEVPGTPDEYVGAG